MRKCPYCAEEIQDESIKCRYCKEILDENVYMQANTKTSNAPNDEKHEPPDGIRLDFQISPIDDVDDHGLDWQEVRIDTIRNAHLYGESLIEVGHKGYCIWLNGDEILKDGGGILYYKIVEDKISMEWAARNKDYFLYEVFENRWLLLLKDNPCPSCGKVMEWRRIAYFTGYPQIREAIQTGYFIKGKGPISNTKQRFGQLCLNCFHADKT